MKSKITLFFFALFSIIFSRENIFGQSGWFQLNSGTTRHLSSVYFANYYTGYVVGDTGLILKTTNGGLNWNTQTSNTVNALLSVSFQLQGTGNTGYTVGVLGTILKTTNGGLNWTSQNSNVITTLSSVSAPGADTAYIATGITNVSGSVLRTVNGGAVWNNIIAGTQPFYSVYFINTITGYAGGGNLSFGAQVAKTTNGGINWTNQTLGIFGVINSVFFPRQNTNIGYGAGFAGIIKTTNAGTNWITINTGSAVGTIFFTSTDTGYAAGFNGLILKTTNGGLNWVSQNTGTSNNLLGIFFTARDTGYAVGFSGTILKTTTGGLTIVKTVENQIPKVFRLYQNYPNPFNPITKIKFDVSSNLTLSGAKGLMVKLNIYDLLGREIATLVNEQLKPGTYEVEWNAANYPSGIYFYKLTTENFSQTKKLIFLK